MQRSVLSQPTVHSVKVFSTPGFGGVCESAAGVGWGVVGAAGAGSVVGAASALGWGAGWLGEQAASGSATRGLRAEKIGLHSIVAV